jgi:hypothetical protein
MDAVTCFITDDRHSVPTLALLVGTDATSALKLALSDLKANLHHHVIEAWTGERRLFVVTRDDLVGAGGAPTAVAPPGAPLGATFRPERHG